VAAAAAMQGFAGYEGLAVENWLDAGKVGP
jgi:hypothetical protein